MPEIMSSHQPQRQNTRQSTHPNVVQTRSEASTSVTPSAMSGYNAPPPMGSSGNLPAQRQAWRNEAPHPKARVTTRNDVQQGLAQQLEYDAPENYGNSNGAYGAHQQSGSQHPVNDEASTSNQSVMSDNFPQGQNIASANIKKEESESITTKSNTLIDMLSSATSNRTSFIKALRKVFNNGITELQYMEIAKHTDIVRAIENYTSPDDIIGEEIRANIANKELIAAAENGDESTFEIAFRSATRADLLGLAINDTAIEKIIRFQNIALRNEILDNIYNVIPNVNLLQQAIFRRFNVPVISKKDLNNLPNFINLNCSEEESQRLKGVKEKLVPSGKQQNPLFEKIEGKNIKWSDLATDWTPNGIQHVYRTYLRIPESDLKIIRSILTFDTESGIPAGGSKCESSMYFVKYNDSQTENVEDGLYTDSDALINDSRKGLNLTDMTIAHELGHLVDAKGNYSSQREFRDLNGWEERPNPSSESNRAFSAIRNACNDPYITSLNTLEKTIAENCGIRAVKEIADEESIINIITDELMKLNKDGNYEGGRTNTNLITILKSSHVFSILPKLWANRSPWMKIEPINNMKYQIHQGYDDECFYSYNTDALKNKISKYQFRDPKDDFAETYATFFVANPIGSKTPPKHREWFMKEIRDPETNQILKPNLDKDGKFNKSIGNNGKITNTSNTNSH